MCVFTTLFATISVARSGNGVGFNETGNIVHAGYAGVHTQVSGFVFEQVGKMALSRAGVCGEWV